MQDTAHIVDEEASRLSSEAKSEIAVKAIREQSEKQLAQILNFIAKADRQLLWIDRLLYHTQPPATGRIRVLWLRPTADSDLYRPRLVSWTLVSKKGAQELWRCRTLSRPTKAVKGKGGFATYRPEVLRLVEIAADLIENRTTMTRYLSDLSRAWILKERHLSEKEIDTVNNIVDIIDNINAKGTLNLNPDAIMV